jgi:hypothetical protein
LKEAFALIAEFEFLDGMPVGYRAFCFYDCEGGYVGGKGEDIVQIGNYPGAGIVIKISVNQAYVRQEYGAGKGYVFFGEMAKIPQGCAEIDLKEEGFEKRFFASEPGTPHFKRIGDGGEPRCLFKQ